MAKQQVWSEKWRDRSSSWDSEDEEREGQEGAGASTGHLEGGEDGNLNDVDSNGIRRSGRPRRVAAKAASGDISGFSDDEPPSKKRARSSATPSRSRAVNERRQAESQTRAVPLNKADEKRLRKRETNKNSARKMRLQRKEELAMLLKEKHSLVDQVAEKSKELKRLYASMNSLQQSNNEMEVGFHNLQRSNEMLVEELLQHITFLRNAGGKVLDPHAIPPIIARFAKCLTAEEANQMMEESDDCAQKAYQGRGRDSPDLLAGEEDRTVYIRVDPRPGTKVQIIKPHAMKPGPSRLGRSETLPSPSPLTLVTQEDHLPKHFQATRPRTGPSKQQLSAGHATFLVPRASSPSVQTPTPSAGAAPPPSGPAERPSRSPSRAAEPPRTEPPLLRLASDLAEGAATLPDDTRRSREGSHPGAAQLRVPPAVVTSGTLPYYSMGPLGPRPSGLLASQRSLGGSMPLPMPNPVANPNPDPALAPDALPGPAAGQPDAPVPLSDAPQGQITVNGNSGPFTGFQPVRGMTRLA